MRNIPCSFDEWINNLPNSVMFLNKNDDHIVITRFIGTVDLEVKPLQMYKTTTIVLVGKSKTPRDKTIRFSSTYEEAETLHRISCEEVDINVETDL